MERRKALFIDADYVVRAGKCYARLLVKGKKTAFLYFQHDPYFYADVDEAGKRAIESLSVKGEDGTAVSPKRTEFAERILDGEPKRLLRVICHEPRHVPILREAIPFPCYEYGIHYGRRFMMDFSLVPFSVISYERDGRRISRFLKSSPGDPRMLRRLAFDTEVYNPLGAPRPSKDPIIMFSFACSDGAKGVVTYRDVKGGNVELVDDEKRMLERFFLMLSEKDVDVLYGYNTTNFDLPYIAERAKRLGIPLALGRDGSPYRLIKKGMINPLKIKGRVHVDLYPVMKFFGFTGLIRTDDYTLKNVYSAVTGKKATKIDRMDIWKQWDSGDIATLTDYALADSLATIELGEMAYPLLSELSTITRMPLFDVAYATSGQLVESLLMAEAAAHNMIIPPKPGGSAVAARTENPIQGAYVKLPEPGIYENIAVFDFRGLYPSIICSYNIDPFTLGKPGEGFESPTRAKFAKSPRGLIPLVLESLIDRRAIIKRQLKSAAKDTEEHKMLSARSHALKILANSFYGYLGYARSRWYSRKCAESVTAWGRMHILAAEEKAKAAGFKVLYMDTDSLFLLLGDKKREDALRFLEEINRELPEKMELELEGFYTRGVFVSKKAEEKGAKKKYALLGDDGRVKIRGFELVRRDWSAVAKTTQRRVLEAILREGSKDKAVRIVREVVEQLRSGKVPLADLAIYTQLKKDPSNYDILSPELLAAQKALKRGKHIERGSIIGYVITRKGKSISDRAELLEFAPDYDPDYYINNQVLPSVLKILKELGADEYELTHGGRQKGMGDFF
ncbi:MAG: DNA-directed DNA polymerase [Candidatus ainarchaeum sp.]|nr:DNA-directed DNA polymerase [Candidatus ainarchaeum sp.]MDD5096583.1 DNA-directed DNA polymerase [Candidatus ainarchaeum sp.]